MKKIPFSLIILAPFLAFANDTYFLNYIENSISKEMLPAPEFEMEVGKDSLKVFDTVIGDSGVSIRKNGRCIVYSGNRFFIEIKKDTLFWRGDSLSYVWIKRVIKPASDKK